MSDTAETAVPVGDEIAGPETFEPAAPSERSRPGSAWGRLERIGSVVAPDREPDLVISEPVVGFRGGLHPGGGVVGEPDVASDGPAVPSGPRGFSIFHVGLVDDDHEWARFRGRLSEAIYTRQVALRLTSAKAKSEPVGGYFALVDPKGRCVGIFATGTGRATGPNTTKRVRRVLQQNGQTRGRRTSRPVTAKRTSRRSAR